MIVAGAGVTSVKVSCLALFTCVYLAMTEEAASRPPVVLVPGAPNGRLPDCGRASSIRDASLSSKNLEDYSVL